jgi:hypothetical protein
MYLLNACYNLLFFSNLNIDALLSIDSDACWEKHRCMLVLLLFLSQGHALCLLFLEPCCSSSSCSGLGTVCPSFLGAAVPLVLVLASGLYVQQSLVVPLFLLFLFWPQVSMSISPLWCCSSCSCPGLGSVLPLVLGAAVPLVLVLASGFYVNQS